MLGQSLARRCSAGDKVASILGRFDELAIAEAPLNRTEVVGNTLAEIKLRALTGASAVGVWFKLKATVNIQAKDINNLHSEMKELKSENNEGNKLIHKRIDSQRDLIEKNRENSDSGISLMTANMNAMELRIIKAIHDIKK